MGGNLRGQNLQRDFAIEFGILGQIHLAHPARPDFGDDAIVRQNRGCCQFFINCVHSLVCRLKQITPIRLKDQRVKSVHRYDLWRLILEIACAVSAR